MKWVVSCDLVNWIFIYIITITILCFSFNRKIDFNRFLFHYFLTIIIKHERVLYKIQRHFLNLSFQLLCINLFCIKHTLHFYYIFWMLHFNWTLLFYIYYIFSIFLKLWWNNYTNVNIMLKYVVNMQVLLQSFAKSWKCHFRL